jgi:Na+/H+-dicarboxylate symporter
MNLARRLADTAPGWARWPRIPVHLQISIGLLVGTLSGLAANVLAPHAPWVRFLVANVTEPIGGLFLRLLFVLVLPLLFSAVISGIAGVRDLGTLRRLAVRAFSYMIVATMLAVLIGLAAVNLFRPGDGIDRSIAHQLLASAKGTRSIVEAGDSAPVGLNALVDLVPFNVLGAASQGNLIGVIFFALLFGIGLVLVRTEATRQLVTTIEGLFQVGMRLIDIVIRFAPIAVACFMFDLTVMFGWSLLAHLGAYVGVVLLALVLHMAIVFSAIVWIGGGMSPITFFRGVQEAAFIAFSTASSHATLPTSLRVAEDRLHLPPELARFVLGIGTSANQNGTAIYQSVTVIFLAQALGVQLALTQQLSVFAICTLGGIGTAGVPAGSLPVVAMILAVVGIPPEAIGLVLGVDRILDMCRTMLNVMGDLAIAVAVARER